MRRFPRTSRKMLSLHVGVESRLSPAPSSSEPVLSEVEGSGERIEGLSLRVGVESDEGGVALW